MAQQTWPCCLCSHRSLCEQGMDTCKALAALLKLAQSQNIDTECKMCPKGIDASCKDNMVINL